MKFAFHFVQNDRYFIRCRVIMRIPGYDSQSLKSLGHAARNLRATCQRGPVCECHGDSIKAGLDNQGVAAPLSYDNIGVCGWLMQCS